MIPSEWLDQARVRIGAHILQTPLVYDARRRIYIKWENRQVTGSFKARGAFNKLLLLEPWELEQGIVCVSAGNHGQGVALAAKNLGAKAEVFVAENAAPSKVEQIRSLEARIHKVRGGYAEAEQAGRLYAEREAKTWVSPYNDGQVIAGQGTVALEGLQQMAALLEGETAEQVTWVVPVGGGGLIAGIGAALSRLSQRPHLVGVQPVDNAFMHSLFYRGTQDGLADLPSLADGLTGAVEDGSVTIPMVKQFVREIVLVSEEELARAVAFAWHVFGEVIEGSGAAALAALLFEKIKTRPALALVSGGNIDPGKHREIVMRYAGEAWN